jgi:hypothetical protein
VNRIRLGVLALAVLSTGWGVESQAQAVIDRAWQAYLRVPTLTARYLREHVPDPRLLEQGMPFRRSLGEVSVKAGWVSLRLTEESVPAWSRTTFGNEPPWQLVLGPARSEWFTGTTGRLTIRWLPAPGVDRSTLPPLHGETEQHPIQRPFLHFTATGDWGELQPARLGLAARLAGGAGPAPQIADWRVLSQDASSLTLERRFGRRGVSRDQKQQIRRGPTEAPLYRCQIIVDVSVATLPRIVRCETAADDPRLDTYREDYTYRTVGDAVVLASCTTTLQPAGTVVGKVTLLSLETVQPAPESAFHIDPAQAKSVYDETARMAIDIAGP